MFVKNGGMRSIIEMVIQRKIDLLGGVMDYKKLLELKGFSLNKYPEGDFWEFIVEDDEKLKEKLCKIFSADIELFIGETDINILILQCAEDFTRCIFYYDCNTWNMETEDFMRCVTRI